jgi:hypothetical protein
MPSLQINDLLEELETRANTILTQAQSTLVQTEPVHIIFFIYDILSFYYRTQLKSLFSTSGNEFECPPFFPTLFI